MLKSGRISVPVNKYKPPQPAIKIKPKPVKVVKQPKTKENETDKKLTQKNIKIKMTQIIFIGLNFFICRMM